MPHPILERQQAIHLRLEGAVFAGLGLALFAGTGQSWWLFAALILAPDLSALGYLSGPRFGAHAYNLGHNLVLPGALVAAGWFLVIPAVLALGAIWWAHIGIDRLVGYGMKPTSGFSPTHLSFQ